jgi:RNA polymerase sigma factor (sigma-70 family)
LNFQRPYIEKKLSDNELIEGIKNRDNNVFDYVYKKYFKQLSNYIIKGGMLDEEDAKDIFQDGIIILWENFQKPNFQMKYKFTSYFFGICRNLLMDRLEIEYKQARAEEKKIDFVSQEINETFSDYYPFTNSEYISNTEIEFQLFSKHFIKLKEDCKNVLKMAYAGIPYDEIAQKMGYKKGTFAKNKKHRCKQYLMDSISTDKMFRLIKK